MILSHLYIDEHRHINDLNIPVSGRFSCDVKDGIVSIKVLDNLNWYYNNFQLSTIIGKNGVGKSTIFDFIENYDRKAMSAGLLVFYSEENSEFNIFCVNYEVTKVEIEDGYKYNISDYYNYIESDKLNIVKADNLSGFESFLYPVEEKISRSKNNLSFSCTDSENHEEKELIFNQFNSLFKSERLKDIDCKKEISFNFIFRPPSKKSIHRFFTINLSKSKITSGEIESLTEDYILSTDRVALFNSNNFKVSLIKHYIFDLLSYFCKFYKENENNKNDDQFYNYFILETYEVLFNLNKEMNIDKVIEKIKEKITHEIINDTFNYEPFKNILIEFYFNINKIADILESNYASYKELGAETITTDSYYFSHELTSVLNSLPKWMNPRFTYGWSGLSTGELAKLNIFRMLNSYIEETKNDRNLTSIILIDEVDLYLHPEWQRTFIKDLLLFLKSFQCKLNLQFIFNTHSPIITSDFLSRDIISLHELKNNKGKRKIILTESYGFGSSIGELYSKGMHITSTFGEHSRELIEKVIDKKNENSLSDEQKQICREIKSENIRRYLGVES